MGPINENKIKKMGPTTKNGSSYFPSNYIVSQHLFTRSIGGYRERMVALIGRNSNGGSRALPDDYVSV